jgi:nucleoside diphosphate kinase
MKTKSNGLNIVDMKTQKNDKHLGKRLYTLKEEADKIAGRVIKYYTGSGVAIKNSKGENHGRSKKHYIQRRSKILLRTRSHS